MGIKKKFIKSDLPKVGKMFAFNVGKEGIIFNKYHPYFDNIPQSLKGFASVNFGLPVFKNGQKV